MAIRPFPRFPPRWRPGWRVLAVLFLIGQAPYAVAQSIVFPHENVSDTRGLLNVLHTFRRACLEQPVDRDLPARLAPEGYRVVSLETHLWGTRTGALTGDSAILSKTGLEQDDREGGYPFVTFSMPTPAGPDGRCAVAWTRAWDFAEGLQGLALGLFGVLDAQVSFNLGAVLRSAPESRFIADRKIFDGVSDWFTWCWDGNFCSFKLRYSFDPGTGIDISISRVAVQP